MSQKPLVTQASVPLGFFGKIPAVGDFVQRNLSVGFVEKWDHWLQNGLYVAHQEMLENWSEVYLTSPIWRFILSPGVIDAHSYVGVMIPSIDSAGRYFPLTVVTAISETYIGRVWSAEANHWFEAVEALMLSVLEKTLPLDVFNQELQSLPASWADKKQCSSSKPSPFVCIELDHVYAAPAVLAGMWVEQFARSDHGQTFWWSAGSDLVSPALLVSRDLPDKHHFSALFNGKWKDHQWALDSWQKDGPTQAPLVSEVQDDLLSDPVVDHGAALEQLLVMPQNPITEANVRSVGLTHTGNVRKINQDAFIELEGAGVWVVADGMGGHLNGERASRLIVEAVSWVTPRLSIDETVEELSLRLANVNQTLMDERYGDSSQESICGSTVVAMIIKKNFFSVVWAGDSRLYLLRDGVLRTVTHDHSLQEESGVSVPRNIITRAVGAAEHLELDVITEPLQKGDRLMLCSDGVYGELRDEEIVAALSLDSLEQALNCLSETVLSKAARDNLTAVLVDYN